jgi:polar amino acid transport system substrate-binding protein
MKSSVRHARGGLILGAAVAIIITVAGCSSSSSPATSAGGPATSSAAGASSAGGTSDAVATECAKVQKDNPSVVGKTFQVGSDPEAPPFETIDSSGKLVGFDIDTMDAVTSCMGAKYSVLKTQFAGLIPALQAGRINMVISSLVATPPRLKEVNFVGYLKQQEGLLTLAGNPDHLTSVAALCGHSVAVIPASLELVFVNEQSAKCTAAGKKPITAEVFTNLTSVITAIVQKRADSSIIGPPFTTEALQQFPGKLYATPVIPAFDATVGIALPKGSTDLNNALYAALKVYQSSGEEKASMAKWKIMPSLFQPTSQLS